MVGRDKRRRGLAGCWTTTLCWSAGGLNSVVEDGGVEVSGEDAGPTEFAPLWTTTSSLAGALSSLLEDGGAKVSGGAAQRVGVMTAF